MDAVKTQPLAPRPAPLAQIQISPTLTITPDPIVLDQLNDQTIGALESWLADSQTLCSNCAPNALAPLLGMVGIQASRETLTAQAFLTDYFSGNLQLRSDKHEAGFSGAAHPTRWPEWPTCWARP